MTIGHEAALATARELISAAGWLGYVGECYSRTQLVEVDARAVRRHVGTAIGATYDVLRPVWTLYPDLDPGRSENPLGITKDDPPSDAACTRERTLEAVERLATVLAEQVPMLTAPLDLAGVSQIEKWAREANAALDALRRRLDGNGR